MNTDVHPAATAADLLPVRETLPKARAGATLSHSANVAVQIGLITFLLLVPVLHAMRIPCVVDPDVWWHMSIGDWIFAHHAFPHTDFMSRSVGGNPWQAYSWLFDTLSSSLFHRFGLAGIVTYTAVMFLLITAACYRLASRTLDFTLSVLLTLFVGFSIWPMETPRSWLFTILFALLEIDILMQARRTGKWLGLLWIPVIIAFWANLHIQFVHGLIFLGIAVAESIFLRWKPNPAVRTRPLPMLCVFAASILAVLVNPYGWRVYSIAYQFATGSAALNKISEIQALPFRDAANYTVLLLAFAVVAVLAYRRELPFFETALLAMGAYFAFHSQRDVWLIAVAACAVLGASGAKHDQAASILPSWALPASICAALLLTAGLAHMYPMQEANLAERQKSDLPVQAVDYVKQNGLQGPLYNDFNWGGYLYWSLGMPVSMDGRVAPYGAEKIDRSIATWNAMPDWADDPLLQSSRLVIGRNDAPLSQLLRRDDRFRLVYSDKLAAVFVRQ